MQNPGKSEPDLKTRSLLITELWDSSKTISDYKKFIYWWFRESALLRYDSFDVKLLHIALNAWKASKQSDTYPAFIFDRGEYILLHRIKDKIKAMEKNLRELKEISNDLDGNRPIDK